MTDHVMDLFDDFSRRYRRGERPDVADYLERAGEGQEDLSRLLDRYLASSPPPPPEPETVRALSAWLGGEPPLLELRRGRGLKRETVVDELVGSLELDPAKREKVDDYWHRLETGLLDPAGVSRRVWEVLERLLGAGARSLAGLKPPPLAAAPAYRRPDAPFLLREQVLDVPPVPPAEEPDEIDRLFTAGDH